MVIKGNQFVFYIDPRQEFVNPPPSYNVAMAETTVVAPRIAVGCEAQPPLAPVVVVDKFKELS